MIRPFAAPSETVIRRQTCPFRIRNKIEVIKNYRETTGVGLTEAKKSIERAERWQAALDSKPFRFVPEIIHLFEGEIR